jgi:hypothetical protein
VPDEDRHRPTFVPYVCMVCHGAGKFTVPGTLADLTNNATPAVAKADVGGQFVAFDTAGYTFSTVNAHSRSNLFAGNTFTKLNQGLLKSAPIMPGELLTNLIASLLVSNRNYTVTPSPAWEATPAAVKLYNQAYAVDCRSCHTTQGDMWAKAEDIQNEGGSYGGNPAGSVGSPMPQPQRTFGVFWGSATASRLNTNVFNAPAALSGTPTRFQ